MLFQAAGLALLAAISPTGLLVAAIYLGSARPRLTVLCYLAGAALMTLVLAVLVLVVLRTGHLDLSRNREPKYGLRLGLGVLILAAAVVLARRKPKPPDPAKPASGLMSRLVARPGPVSALLAGFLLYGPSMTYIAAVQVIGTARAGAELTVAGVLLVMVIDLMLIWVPLLAFLAAPGPTTRYLLAFNGWLRAHGRSIALVALTVAGAFMIINGLLGLVRAA